MRLPCTPPPGPEVVERLAATLDLSDQERRWLQWLAIRDRCDPHSRTLVELYERLLLTAWETNDHREIVEQLGEQIELANFVVASKPVYLRHCTNPVFVRVHDEGGQMSKSLVGGWIVRVDPVRILKDSLPQTVVGQVVLVNWGRRCRIGWLRMARKRLFLEDDWGRPFESGAARHPGRASEEFVIARTATTRPYVGDIQAVIPSDTLEEIHRRRSKREQIDEDLKRRRVYQQLQSLPPIEENR